MTRANSAMGSMLKDELVQEVMSKAYKQRTPSGKSHHLLTEPTLISVCFLAGELCSTSDIPIPPHISTFQVPASMFVMFAASDCLCVAAQTYDVIEAEMEGVPGMVHAHPTKMLNSRNW